MQHPLQIDTSGLGESQVDGIGITVTDVDAPDKMKSLMS